jgi:hypothetical protein
MVDLKFLFVDGKIRIKIRKDNYGFEIQTLEAQKQSDPNPEH